MRLVEKHIINISSSLIENNLTLFFYKNIAKCLFNKKKVIIFANI